MRLSILLAVVLAIGCGAAPPRPVAGFAVPADVGALVVDDAAFASFARSARAELERDPGASDAERVDRLFLRALLDALDGRWPEAVAALDGIVALEPDPVQKAMTGLTIRVWADALAAGGELAPAVRVALDARLDALPSAAADDLRMLRTMAQVFTPEVCRELVATEVAPRVDGGRVSLSDARTIAFQRYAVVRLVPIAAVIDEALGARGIEPFPTDR